MRQEALNQILKIHPYLSSKSPGRGMGWPRHSQTKDAWPWPSHSQLALKYLSQNLAKRFDTSIQGTSSSIQWTSYSIHQFNPVDIHFNPGDTQFNPVDIRLNPVDIHFNPGDTQLNPVDIRFNPGDGKSQSRGRYISIQGTDGLECWYFLVFLWYF